jgi:hypothetical protein
MSAARDRAKDR